MSTSQDALSEAIAAVAAGPASVSVDGTATTFQRVADQIAAAQYLDASKTRERNHLGIVCRKVEAPAAG